MVFCQVFLLSPLQCTVHVKAKCRGECEYQGEKFSRLFRPRIQPQHSAYRGSSHLRNVQIGGNVANTNNMFCLYRLPIAMRREWGLLLPMVVTTCLQGGYRRGRGRQHPV